MSSISIILPGIRKENWINLYNSIKTSTTRDFELIIVGPYEPDEWLLNQSNIIFVKDFGNPVRCQNIGIELASKKYITWASDDRRIC